MKFTELLSKLIIEQSRFQVLYDKMVKPVSDKEGKKGIIDFDVLKNIIFADPTTRVPENFDKEDANVQDMENVKVGKYVQWLLKNFIIPKPTDLNIEGEVNPDSEQYRRIKKEYQRLFLEDLFKQTERLDFYEKVKQYLPQEQRDINKLSIKDLFYIFANFQLPENKLKDKEKKQAKKTREGLNHKGGEIVFKGSNWTVIRISDKGPTGKDAAVYYGGYKDHRSGESDWCTSSPGLNFFDSYIKQGPIYVIFPNDDNGQVGDRTGLPKERYQFHFPSKQFMDRNDHKIDLVSALNGEMLELKDFFKSDFAESLFNEGKKLIEIIYPTNIQGKFAGLYGFNNIFDYIPENTQMIMISNDSNEDIDLDVPSSIGKFKELNTLGFNNIVRTIPDEIEQLKKLQKCFLTNNKNLVSLPKSIINLPNLIFIRLRDNNPDLEIPSIFEKRLSDDGDGFYFVN